MKELQYAQKRINILKSEMGEIKSVFKSEEGLFIQFKNGMNLQLHDEEINYQAIEYLESEIEQIRKR